MSGTSDFKFNLKALINKNKTKVLYVEANSDFVDVLLSFLTLPLGTIVRVLNRHYGGEAPVIGSLTTLFNGLLNMDDGLFLREDYKNLLLNPISSSEVECRRLKINVDDSPPIKYFKCGTTKCLFYACPNVSMYYSGLKCSCGKPLDRAFYVKGVDNGDGCVFIRSKASFIISDNLQVSHFSVETLRNLGITDTVGTEERNLTFGFNEIMDLLKLSLISGTPFTEHILGKKLTSLAAVKCETGILPAETIEQLGETFNAKKMRMKAILSVNKLLFAEVDGDFVDFLFSLLAIPLGGVECLMGQNTGLKNIDNFHKSIANSSFDKYLKFNDNMKAQLFQPKLPFCYNLSPVPHVNSANGQQVSFIFPEGSLNYVNKRGAWISKFTFPEGKGKYVEGSTMYMVTDDLTVTPMSSTSALSILKDIPLSDVKELELDVGIKEALSILKASLTSARALTDGLIIPALRKHVKQEG